MTKGLRKARKITLWIIGIIVSLLLLVLILIQIPAVQNYAKDKAVAYLQNKLKTKVAIGNLSISFPKEIVLKDVYFEDQKKDTLLFGKELRVNIALFKLLSNEVQVSNVELTGIRSHIYRTLPDTTFNFDYIINAFASKEKKTPDPSDTTSMKISLGNITLTDIAATYKDDVTGNDVYFALGSFKTNIKTFDLDKMKFSIAETDISNITSRVRQYKPLVILTPAAATARAAEPNKKESLVPSVEMKQVKLTSIKFNYNNEISALMADINLGELITKPGALDLKNQSFKIDQLDLNNTTAKVVMGKSAQKPAVVKVKEDTATVATASLFNIQFEKINFKNNNLNFDNENLPKAKEGMDYAHLAVKGLALDANGLYVSTTAYKGRINQLSFTEQSGLNLKKLQTDFAYNEKGAQLNNLLLQTDKTTLQNKVTVSYPSLEMIAKQPGEIYVDAYLKQSSFAVQDMLIFMPSFRRNVRGYENSIIKLNGIVKGFVKDLAIPTFEVSGIGNTYAKISGTIKGLPNADKANFDIKVDRVTTTRKDLEALLPKGTIPDSIRIPKNLSLSGFFKGGIKNFNTHLIVATSNGNADVTARMNGNSYNANASVKNIDVGYILMKDSLIGKITMKAKVNGSGTDIKTANATFDADIISAYLKGYDYKNLTVKGNTKAGIAKVIAKMKDQNIAFDLDATADMNNKFPAVKLALMLDTLNLYALHLMDDTLSLHANIAADMASTNPDYLIGNVNIKDIIVVKDNNKIVTDSVAINATATDSAKTLTVFSDFLKANLSGQYKLTEIGQALQHTINKYYQLPDYKEQPITPQTWQLNAVVIPSKTVLQLIPDLKGSDSLTLQTKFNSSEDNIDLAIRGKQIIFGKQQIDSINITAKTAAEKLGYNVSLGRIQTPSFVLNQTNLNGGVANNEVDANFATKDTKGKDQYQLAAIVKQIPEGVRMNLKQDSIVLNYDKWIVPSDNFIQYDKSGVIVNNFVLSSNDQSLSINSTSQVPNAPIKVDFKNFKISSVTKIANQQSLPLDGIINGNAEVKDVTTNPVFTADIKVDDILYAKDTIGTLLVKVNNEEANAFVANIALQGRNNDVTVDGKYYTGEGKMDLKMKMNQLDLATIKPFSQNQIQDIKGFLKGNVNFEGTVDQPKVNGELHFENAVITPTITGEPLKLSNETIEVDGQGIHMSDFTLVDSAGNKAILNGNINTTDFKKYGFDIDLDADNFQVVNAPKTPNKLFYGKLNIDAYVELRGDMDAPTVNGDLKVNSKTDFSLVLPSSDPEIADREGVVRFIDKDNPGDTLKQNVLDSLADKIELKGMDVNMNIQTDSAAAFTMIIDERNGDALTVRGKADLAGGIDKSGKVSLTGSYQLERGAYQLSLSFLKRRFEIVKGSTITWTGDPTTAIVDITAKYVSNAPSIDLVGPQLTGRAQDEINRFKEKLPFEVNLKMEGELLKPLITFDITLPDDVLSDWPEVDAKLQQVRADESELNKQVFALLLLNRFVGENPFQSLGDATNAGLIAKQSAGKILTDQLNNLSSSLIKGVDLNFDINSDRDYTTGSAQDRTDLTVGVSKKLFSDRIQVNIGSNFQIDGPANNNREASNIAGDVAVDYRLSKDGRYTLRAYRKNKYQGVVEGQIIETGLTFIFTLDYDKFSELFHSKKEKQPRKTKTTTDVKGDKKTDK